MGLCLPQGNMMRCPCLASTLEACVCRAHCAWGRAGFLCSLAHSVTAWHQLVQLHAVWYELGALL